MKSLVITALLAAGLTSAAFAQNAPSISQRATEYTRTLAPHLGLDDGRQLQLKKLTVARMQQEQQIEQMYAGDEAARQPKLQAVADQYRTDLKALLTPGQYQRYEQWATTATTNATAAKP